MLEIVTQTYSHINDKAPEVDEQTSLQENKDSEERPPLKNSLPPLPERPTAAQRKARSSKQSKPSDQTSSPEKPATAAKAEATKSGDPLVLCKSSCNYERLTPDVC